MHLLQIHTPSDALTVVNPNEILSVRPIYFTDVSKHY